jgi:hypothetical protein
MDEIGLISLGLRLDKPSSVVFADERLGPLHFGSRRRVHGEF